MRGEERRKSLRHTREHQQCTADERDREQQIERNTCQIDIEITDGFQTTTGKGAHDGGRRCNARGGGDKHVHDQAEHLRAVGDLRLRHVSLPVGVGREARGGIEREARRHAGDVLRVPGQVILQPQDRIEQEEMDDAEQQQGDGIILPAHGALRINAGELVEAVFQRCEKFHAAFENRRHVASQREGAAQHQHEHQRDVKQTLNCHCV